MNVHDDSFNERWDKYMYNLIVYLLILYYTSIHIYQY